MARLADFGKTGRLSSLGQFRYALARRHEGSTTLLLLWTEGDAKLAELFPKTGDAPGRDLPDLPRPKGGQRLLSAFEQGMPFGFVTYHLDGKTGKTVVGGYMALLAASGWNHSRLDHDTFLAEKSGRRVLVRVGERGAGRVVVSLSDLG